MESGEDTFLFDASYVIAVTREYICYLDANPNAKLSDVAEKTGISLSSVKKMVSSLKSEGHLKNDGTNRNSRWVVL